MSWNAQGWGSTSGATPAGSTASSLLASSPEKEKSQLVIKLRGLQKSRSDFKSKWWSFCKVHGDGKSEPENFDFAFLQTFLESFESGQIVDQPGCPFGEEAGTALAGVGAVAGAGEKVFIGGLPRSCTEDKTWSHFEQQFGKVTKVEFKYDDNGGFRGFGFVTFQDKASAQAVLDNRDNNYLEGKWIDCKPAQTGKGKGGKGVDGGAAATGAQASWGGASNDSWNGENKDSSAWNQSGKAGGNDSSTGGANNDAKIFVGGLPKATATEEKVTSFFSHYGNVARCDLKYDEQGNFRGFGFVTFSDASAVQLVLGDQNIEFEGKWIDCKTAVSSGTMKGKTGKGGDKGGDKGGSTQGGGQTNSWGSGGGGNSWGGDWGAGGGGGDWNKNTSQGWGSSGNSSRDSWTKSYNTTW